MQRFRRFIPIALVTVALLGAAATWRAGVTSDSTDVAGPAVVTTAAASDVVIPVTGVAAVRGTLTLTITAAAQAAAWREAVLPSHQSGQVARLGVREDDAVEERDELAALDATEYRLALREAEAAVEVARAEYADLTLFDDRIGDAAVRAERQRVARARSGLDAALVRLERAQLELERTVVRAPFDGRVASIEAEPGEWVRAGDPLLRVVDIDPIRIEVQVLEGEVRWLRRGGHAEVELAALGDEVFAGTVASVNPVVDPELRTAKVTVVVANPDGRILPGMYARVRLDGRRYDDRLLVPRSAILERDRRTLVFVYEGDARGGVARWRYVTPGLGNDEQVELVDAADGATVAAGDIVLTDGHYSLIHDARVQLVEDLDGAGGARPE